MSIHFKMITKELKTHTKKKWLENPDNQQKEIFKPKF